MLLTLMPLCLWAVVEAAPQSDQEGTREGTRLSDTGPTWVWQQQQQLVASMAEQQQQLVASMSGQQQQLVASMAEQLRRQERVIQQQGVLLSAQAASIQQLSDRQDRQDQLLAAHTHGLARLDTDMAACLAQLQRFKPPTTGHGGPQLTSRGASHVAARADDAGPLEAVISQLSQQVSEVEAENQVMKTVYLQHDIQLRSLQDGQAGRDAAILNASTSTFTAWGRSSCPDPSRLVYSGVVGGSSYTQTGAAANYLCLTMAPTTANASIGGGANLYGAEYEVGGAAENRDAVCAVCRAPLPATVMVPGTHVCPSGWHAQYSGFLMAGASVHAAAGEYICVDWALEGRPGSEDDHNGKLLFGVQARCGSLPCDPYRPGQDLTCVVCSQ